MDTRVVLVVFLGSGCAAMQRSQETTYDQAPAGEELAAADEIPTPLSTQRGQDFQQAMSAAIYGTIGGSGDGD